jgi:hypothetical protein
MSGDELSMLCSPSLLLFEFVGSDYLQCDELSILAHKFTYDDVARWSFTTSYSMLLALNRYPYDA